MNASSYEVYEEHLKNLEEQLVALTIENQNLVSELQNYKDKESIDRLKTEINIERNRFKHLQDKFRQIVKRETLMPHLRLSKRKSNLTLGQPSHEQLKSDYDNESIQSTDTVHDWVDVSLKPRAKVTAPEKSKKEKFKSRMSRKIDKMWKKIVELFHTIMEDFSEEPLNQTDADEDELTVKQLKENIIRFKTDLKPFLDTITGIQRVLEWDTPSYTLLVFVVYLLAAWNGCLMSLVFVCLAFRLFISYLNQLGFNVRLNFFSDDKSQSKVKEDDLGLSDKFNIVIEVAKKVQNWLGSAADSLEKIQSLLLWRTPVTTKLFMILCIASFVTLTTNIISQYSHFIGIAMGIKMFIINYFYKRYPRLKEKYDSTHKMWQELPTTKQYEKHYVKSEIDKYRFTEKSSDENEEEGEASEKTENSEKSTSRNKYKDTDKDFCQLFSLPDSECPVTGWNGGRKCTLINKEKSVLNAFKNGKLYLTKSFLCFERTKTPSKKNIVIPLCDITALTKAKPYAILPGSGMSIEVTVGRNKSFTFGALMNRDEAYESIVQAGLDQSLPWATGVTLDKNSSTRSSLKKRSSSDSMTSFTWAADYNDAD